jgi:aspartate oxidase
VHDVLVLGSGVAGLTTALQANRRGLSVLLLTKGELSHSATRYAQGGVAAALANTAGAAIADNDKEPYQPTEFESHAIPLRVN